MKDNNPGYDFFTQASKIILFIPVILLVFLIMTWGGEKGKKPAGVIPRDTQMQRQSVSSAPSQTFNLSGPWVCSGEFQTGTMAAMIKDRAIVATVSAAGSEVHYLVKGDCLYRWGEAKNGTGTKTCGIGGLLTMADSLMSTGLFSLDSLFSAAGISNPAVKGEDAASLMKSCKKQIITQPGAFDLPKGVFFTEKKKS